METDLVRAPRRDEHHLAGLLVYPMAHNPVLPVELLKELRVQVELLRVDGIAVVQTFELPVQKLAELRGVSNLEDVPCGTPGAAVRAGGGVSHDVDRVGHVEVEARRAFAALGLERGLRVVHFGAWGV